MSKYHLASKDIEDALLSRGRISAEVLAEIAQKKGILVSTSTNKERLAKYIATIPFDDEDIDYIYGLIDINRRRERTTSSRISKLEDREIRDSLDRLKDMESGKNEVFNIKTDVNAPVMRIDYSYDEIDYSKAKMLQSIRRKVEIQISKVGEKTVIRYPDNQQCKEFIEKFLKEAEAETSKRINKKEISLSTITDTKDRFDFFHTLVSRMEGMEPDNVISICVYKPKEDSQDHEDSQDVVDFDDTAQVDDTTEKDQFIEVEDDSELDYIAPSSFIRKVIMEGSALFGSSELKSFQDRGFQLTNVKWHAIDTSQKIPRKIELEAGFSNQEECSGFRYDVKGYYGYIKDSNSYQLTKKPLSDDERISYFKKLEDAAESFLESYYEKIQNLKNGNNKDVG